MNMHVENGLSYFDIKEQTGFLRNLIIRNSIAGDIMVIVVFYYEDAELRKGLLDFLHEKFPADQIIDVRDQWKTK